MKKPRILFTIIIPIILLSVFGCLNKVEEPYRYPTLEYNINLDNYGYPYGVHTDENYAYITVFDGSSGYILVCDISSNTIEYVQSIDLALFMTVIPDEISEINNYLITIGNNTSDMGYLFLYNKSLIEGLFENQFQINTISFLVDNAELYSFDIKDNFVYITGFNKTEGFKLYIVDVSDPTDPTLLYEEILNENEGHSIRIVDDLMFIGSFRSDNEMDKKGVVYIYNISTPLSPQIIGTYNSSTENGWVKDIKIDGNYMYLANWRAGFEIVDISDISNPTYVSNYTFNYSVEAIESIENYGLVCGGLGGFFMLDISDRVNPVKVGYTIEPTYANFIDIHLDNNMTYVIDIGNQRLYKIQVAD
jgi:hypothetical protein